MQSDQVKIANDLDVVSVYDAMSVPGMVIRKARDLGFNLPIGQLGDDGKLIKSFSLRELSPEIEIAIGEHRKLNQMKPNTITYTHLLALCLEKIGATSLKFPSLDENRKIDLGHNAHYQNIIRIRKMYMADVFYMFLRCRIEEMGATYTSPWQCSMCGLTRTIETDLEDMNVVCCDDPSFLKVECTLHRGLVFRDGTPKKRVTVTPMVWGNMEKDEILNAGSDSILMKYFFIANCITGVEGFDGEILLTEDERSTIKKIDREIVSDKINDMNLGPSMQISGECPNGQCKTPYSIQLNWDYDSFFSSASL